MLRSTAPVLTVLALLTAGVPGPSRGADRRPRIAVMDLRSLGAEANTAELLSEIALTEASSIGGVEVIGRSEINAVLGLEKQKQMFGCAEDGSCLAEIAGALGVDFVVIGSVGRIGQLYRLDMKLLDAKKARARDRIGETIQADQEKLLPAVQRAIRKLLAPIAAEAQATADARTQTSAARSAAAAVAPAPASAAAPATAVASNPDPAPTDPSSGWSGWGRKRWSAVTGTAGVLLVAVGGVTTGKALQETKYIRDVQFSTMASACPPDCNTPRKRVADSEDTWSNRMRSADLANGLGWTLVGTSLWLGLSSDQPAPGEPRRFLGLAQRTWGYILAGTGVVVGASGIPFGKKASDLRGEAADLLVYQTVPPYAMPNPDLAYARGWAAIEYQRIRNRLYLQGGGLVAAGAVLWFTGGASAPPVAVDVMPTAGGAMAFLSGSF